MTKITGYHAHVYYDAAQKADAQLLCETLRDRFSIPMGRMHDQAVGPHPRGSCQLTVTPENFSDVIQWLVANRNGFTIFAHALSGDEIKDHTDHVIWLGPSEPLERDEFRRNRFSQYPHAEVRAQRASKHPSG